MCFGEEIHDYFKRKGSWKDNNVPRTSAIPCILWCSWIIVSTYVGHSRLCAYINNGYMHHNDHCIPITATEQFPVVSVVLATIPALLVRSTAHLMETMLLFQVGVTSTWHGSQARWDDPFHVWMYFFITQALSSTTSCFHSMCIYIDNFWGGKNMKN